MAERPILFNGAMVRAILSGAKTQTRRAIKPQPFEASALDVPGQYRPSFDESDRLRVATSSGVHLLACPFGQPGDRLWVRERFKPVASGQVKNGYGEVRYGYAYEADSSTLWNKRTTIIHDLTGQPDKGPMQFQHNPWKPAICMPHRACRLVLEISAVRVERLQDGDGDTDFESRYLAEGINRIHHGDGDYYYSGLRDEPHPKNWCHPDDAFRELWIGAGGDWDSNPWVWVIEFKRVEVGQ
ncbi:TPA: hypothetical protein ACOEQZ_001257 [Stenotrophomonas maltophilia]